MALELTSELPNDEYKPRMIKKIAQEGGFDREIIKQCLEQAQKIPEATYRVIPLSSVVLPLDGMTAYEKWILLSEGMVGTRRTDLLFMIYTAASVVRELGGDEGLWQTANAINAARKWM